MKRSGAAFVAALLAVIALAAPASATTIWTARISGHGAATIRVGSPDRLSIGLTSYRAGTTYTVALRRGSCSSLGTLILSTRLTASSTGRLTRTITMTAAQTREAKLPLTLRVGSTCASFAAPVVVVLGPHFGDGIFKVGDGGIAPGTYRTAGSASCYWARLAVLGGSDILANYAGIGPAVVTIFVSDGAIKSVGCGTWVLNAPGVPTASPGDGTWRVGLDIKPGTYRSPGGEACHWARLFGYAGNSQIVSHRWPRRSAAVRPLPFPERGVVPLGPCLVWQVRPRTPNALRTLRPGEWPHGAEETG